MEFHSAQFWKKKFYVEINSLEEEFLRGNQFFEEIISLEK